MSSPLLRASLSHYIAKRDKAIAELDVFLNRPAGVGEHAKVTDEVITLLAELDSADSVIKTINSIIEENGQKSSEIQNIAKAVIDLQGKNNEITNGNNT